MNDMTIDGKSVLESFLDRKLQGLESKGLDSAGKKNLTDAERAGFQKAARGFESVFFGMLFKQMKETKLDQGSEEDGFGADVLDGYTNMLLADQVSNTGKGIGIAQMIYKQLTGEDLPSKTIINPAPVNGIIKGAAPSVTTKQDDIIAENPQPQDVLQSKNVLDGRAAVSSSVSDKVSRWDEIINQASEKFDLPSGLVKAVVAAESAGNPNAVSSAGAKGLMQLMDSTASDVGVKNSFNPADNINGGANYLKQMLDRFDGNIDHALAAYNAGPGNVDKYGGVPPFDETRSYVSKVKKYINYYK